MTMMTDDNKSLTTIFLTLQASLLKRMGADIITIGVGGRVNHQELESVANDVQHSFAVASFSSLKSIEDELVATACEGLL